MKIYIGSDHQGFHLKEAVHAWLQSNHQDVEDVGDKILNPDDDYPQFAQRAAQRLLSSDENEPRAILICGGGQGMAMVVERLS